MIFEAFAVGGCKSYLIACADTRVAALVDPEISLLDRYLSVGAREGLQIQYLIDTHTHADHFSATRQLAQRIDALVVMHRYSPAPFVDLRLEDGDMLAVGNLRLQALYTPGHTRDSMCLVMHDRVFTGDTLLIGGSGRTDLPSGDPEALYNSLFHHLLKLDPSLLIYPAHDYKGRGHSSIGDELASNPRLQTRNKADFVTMMRSLDLDMPTHITEALRTNMSGGKTVALMLAEAAESVPFMSVEQLRESLAEGDENFIILDVREREAFEKGHLPQAKLLPRGQLELRVNQDLPDPTRRILVYCEVGRVSTLAAATLRQMGFMRTVTLDGGIQAWREAGFPLQTE